MADELSAAESRCPSPPEKIPVVRDLVGLALSGGGIRSASFNLGVLQGLAERNVLWAFDYLSTVSGGGFVGAWWSAWLSRAEREPGTVFPALELLEPDRRQATARLLDGSGGSGPVPTLPDATKREARRPEASRIARQNDPIHFLRIFSNYLTPKTGALSPDTWRLIAWYARSLLFTWVALLPLLCAAVLLAQSYYLTNNDVAHAFLCPAAPVAPVVTDAAHASPDVQQASPNATAVRTAGGFCTAEDIALDPARSRALRLHYFLKPASYFLAASITLAFLWLAHSSARLLFAWTGIIFVGLIARLLLPVFDIGPSGGIPWGIIAVVAGTLAWHLIKSARDHQRTPDPVDNESRPAVRASAGDHRAWLTRQQALVLEIGTLVLLLLLFAGFAQDIVWFFTGAYNTVALPAVRKAGGWGAVLLTVISAAYTGAKASPSSASSEARPPGKVGKLLMAIAPPLVLLCLALAFGMLSRKLVAVTMSEPSKLLQVALAVGWLGLLEVIFGVYESYNDPPSPADEGDFSWHRFVPDPLLRVLGQEKTVYAGPKRPWVYLFSPRGWARIGAAIGLIVLIHPAHFVLWPPGLPSFRLHPFDLSGVHWPAESATTGGFWRTLLSTVSTLVRTFLPVAILLTVIGITWARRSWKVSLGSARPVVLLAIACASAALDIVATNPDNGTGTAPPLLAALLWVALLVGVVIGIGWLADPNLLSMHGFYKARLVRAYLGASNTARDNEEIADAAPGDDVKLTGLWNHSEGGPYHLVNTTLNLVGASDLATSQRNAENFVMSRYHCGSARTGYRCSAEYMSGELTLGTAAAVSGAAVSPVMGSQTPSAALTLLLSLMNVRLGFWAPVPSGRRWNESHARLWPFYLLRETIANTGTLGTYCYLTDGGHFDNTGLYALVERACRYIVVCDCGADPLPGFQDIGTAIRRCRIDFGTEISLDISKYGHGYWKPTRHVVQGTIAYQDAHLEMLGIEPTAETRQGVILWIKPIVTPSDTADVRQYKLANKDFPQQSTADQWYDESQFESYRRVGYDSAREAFPGGVVPGDFSNKDRLFSGGTP